MENVILFGASELGKKLLRSLKENMILSIFVIMIKKDRN